MKTRSWKKALACVLPVMLSCCLVPTNIEAAELLEASEAIKAGQAAAGEAAALHADPAGVTEAADITVEEASVNAAEVEERAVPADDAEVEGSTEAAANEADNATDNVAATEDTNPTNASETVEAAEAAATADATEDARFTDAGMGEGARETRVELNSGAERSDQFVSADETFDTPQGTYRLVMGGLKEQNREALVEALAQYFEVGSAIPLTLVDEAFADAEKYDGNPDINPFTGEGYYDSKHCWAGSASNMLWVSGWAPRLVNPTTGQPFSSEDDVFEYFNASFSDGGSVNEIGIDWFFMGEYFHVSYSGGTAMRMNSKNPEDGLMKEFVSTLAQEQFELIDSSSHPELIEQILRVGAVADEGDPAVIEACIGWIHNRELTKSTHSVTAAGLIVDPNAQALSERYRAIVIVDSDNDAMPSEQMGKGTDGYSPTVAEKNADKEARPNTVTVYGLELIDATSKSGESVPCWKILGYGETTEYGAEWIIYKLNALPLYDEELIQRYTEQLGTKTVVSDVDLSVETVYTTDNPEPLKDLYWFDLDEETVTEFEQGELINLGFLLQNRSSVVLDEAKADGRDLTASWKVVRDVDGVVVAEGQSVCSLPVPGSYECSCVVSLNALDGGAAVWEPGAYTAALEINAELAIVEAYYLNNVPVEAHFVVKPSGEPASDEDAVTPAKTPVFGDSNESNSTCVSSVQVAASVLPGTGDPTEPCRQLVMALVISSLISFVLGAVCRVGTCNG